MSPSRLAVRAPVAFDGERFRDDGATVLVTDGRIVGVEPGRHQPPEGWSLVEVDGTLLPGLIDAHVHLVSDAGVGALERAGELDDAALDAVITASLELHAAAGVTTVVDLGDVGYRTLAHREAAAPGLPRVLSAGPPLTVPGGHCHFLGGVVDGPAAIRGAVAERAERGVDLVKVMASGGMLTEGTDVLGTQFSPPDLRLLVDCAHEAGLRVHAHAHSLSAAWAGVQAGVDGLEHFSCLTERGPDANDAVLAAVARAGIVVDPTAAVDREAIARLGPPPPALQRVLDHLGTTFDEIHEQQLAALGRLRALGVVVVTGTDGGAGPGKGHGIVALAVADLVDGGWPVADALVTATSGAADRLGLAAVTGRLAPGLAADLVVVPGDPRRDVGHLARPAAVWTRGVRVTRPH